MPAIARATLWATRTGSPLRGTATVSAPTTTASRSAISTTTVASGADADARISNHDRGRVTRSPVSVPAAAVTTPTRDDGHHDGCTTTARLPGTQVSARRAARHSDGTATGRSPTSATASSMASSAAATTSWSAEASASQHNCLTAPGPASTIAWCELTAGSNPPG